MKDLYTEIKDFRYLNWTRIRSSSGTAGSYLKAYETINGRKMYYKLSAYDSVNGITGHECVNELIVSRLLDVLGIEHLSYQLMHGIVRIDGRDDETWICASWDYKQPGESKMALDDFYDLNKQAGETPMEFCVRMGWQDYIQEMLVVDYLILNRDRHGANMEVLRDRKGNVRLAPLFDHGLSLLYSCHTEREIKDFDLMADKPVQCFVGSRSAKENLKLITSPPVVRVLEERDRSLIMNGLDAVIPKTLQDAMWNMIWERWCVYEDMRDH